MDDTTIRGSCLCGGAGFAIRPPFLFFHYCHCSRCRKTSGTAHAANILLRRDQLVWNRGEDLVRRYELPGAEHFCSGFCGVCGSSMPWLTRTGKAWLVPAGALDDDPGLRPDCSIFWDSRSPWYVKVNELPAFAEGKR